MAEEAKGSSTGTTAKPQKPMLLIILVVLNMVFMGAVGAMLYLNKKKEQAKPTIENVIEGEHKAQAEEEAKVDEFVGETVPLETFLVNLSGSRGGKLVKINMEFEIQDPKVREELDKRKSQVRDIIIILLSSKTFEQLSTKEGKEFLRTEIRDTVNAFLTKGKIQRVLFTDFILS